MRRLFLFLGIAAALAVVAASAAQAGPSPRVTDSGQVRFGTVDVGQTGSQTVTFTNTSKTVTLAANSKGTTMAGVGVGSGCANLAPGGTCTLTVTFSPTAAGRYSGVLTVDWAAPESETALTTTKTRLSATAQMPACQNLTQGFDSVSSSGWFRQNNSTDKWLTWYQGIPAAGGYFDAYQGASTDSYAAVGKDSTNSPYLATVSNWLISPPVILQPGASISFWTRSQGLAPDRLQVRLSLNTTDIFIGTSSDEVGDFTTVPLTINAEQTTTGYPTTWTQETVDITTAMTPTATMGRIAFRYYVGSVGTGGNGDYIGVDSFSYTCPA